MLGRFKFRAVPIQRIRQIRQRKRDRRDREEAFYRLLVAEKKKLRGRKSNGIGKWIKP